jgi:hypothetical protein
LVGIHRRANRLELEQQFLEPQLIDLVNDDEQQLVVGRRIRQQLLETQKLVEFQIGAVGEFPALLAETRGPRAGTQLPTLPVVLAPRLFLRFGVLRIG